MDDSQNAPSCPSASVTRLAWRADAAAPRVRSRQPARWQIVVLVLMIIGFSVTPIVNVLRGKFNKDYDLWQQTGQVLLAGGAVYPSGPQLFPFMYPPSCAAMLALPSALPRLAFVGGLIVLNAMAWVACILGSVYLATGRVWDQRRPLYLLPSLAVIPFVHDTFMLGQPAVLLLALLLLGFVCLRRGRPVSAGALMAVAAGIKAYPILIVGYLIYRRQWRATAALGITLAALLFVAPLAFRTPGQVANDFRLWARGMIFKYDQRTIGQRPDRAYSFKNQSIQATVHRLARPVLANGENDRVWKVNLLRLSFRATTFLMLGVIGAVGLFFLWSAPFVHDGIPRRDAFEQAMVIILLLMMAPLSFNYSYVWLIFPLTVLGQLSLSAPVGSAPRRSGWAVIASSVILLALAVPMPKTAQAYGSVFFSGLVLYLGLGLALRMGWARYAVGLSEVPPLALKDSASAPAASV